MSLGVKSISNKINQRDREGIKVEEEDELPHANSTKLGATQENY